MVALFLVPVDGSLGARLCALLLLCMISFLNWRVMLLPAYLVIISCKAVKDPFKCSLSVLLLHLGPPWRLNLNPALSNSQA